MTRPFTSTSILKCLTGIMIVGPNARQFSDSFSFNEPVNMLGAGGGGGGNAPQPQQYMAGILGGHIPGMPGPFMGGPPFAHHQQQQAPLQVSLVESLISTVAHVSILVSGHVFRRTNNGLHAVWRLGSAVLFGRAIPSGWKLGTWRSYRCSARPN